jgi:transcription elongation factor SPT6
VKLLKSMDQGEVVVRPSSKGTDHLTVTWKVADEVFQQIDVREVGKENTFSLGTSLFIGSEEFEDLDEIIARYINPMAGYARDIITFKYYRDQLGGLRDKAEELLKEEKKKNPNKIHYFLSASKSYPGKFMISYLPRQNCKHEYVSINPEGFKFRQQMFDNVNSLMKWFKEHFKDPLPVQTPGSVSARSSYATPGLSVHSEYWGICEFRLAIDGTLTFRRRSNPKSRPESSVAHVQLAGSGDQHTALPASEHCELFQSMFVEIFSIEDSQNFLKTLLAS